MRTFGTYSLYAAQAASRVHAFEPFPENASRLRANLELNGCRNVEVHELAVGDESGECRLYLSEQSSGHLMFDHNQAGTLTESVPVEMVPFGQALDQHVAPGPIALVKMDCEGSEGAALSSLEDRHFGRIEQFELEYHDGVSALQHHEIEALFLSRGYEVQVEVGGGPFGYVHARRP